MTDLREALGAQRLAGEVARHRHRWDVRPTPAMLEDGDWRLSCRCGVYQDVEKTRKGRGARRKGNDFERDVANRLGIKRVGMYGGPEDAAGDWIIVQCKVGGAFPELPWRWLQALPANADQLRAVIIGDAPGSSFKRRREVIVLDLSDFIDWFGKP